jgi:hypothetical protein
MAFKLSGHGLPGPNQKKNSALPKTSPFLDAGHGGSKWQKMNKGHTHDFETNKFRVEDDDRSIHLKNEDETKGFVGDAILNEDGFMTYPESEGSFRTDYHDKATDQDHSSQKNVRARQYDIAPGSTKRTYINTDGEKQYKENEGQDVTKKTFYKGGRNKLNTTKSSDETAFGKAKFGKKVWGDMDKDQREEAINNSSPEDWKNTVDKEVSDEKGKAIQYVSNVTGEGLNADGSAKLGFKDSLDEWKKGDRTSPRPRKADFSNTHHYYKAVSKRDGAAKDDELNDGWDVAKNIFGNDRNKEISEGKYRRQLRRKGRRWENRAAKDDENAGR